MTLPSLYSPSCSLALQPASSFLPSAIHHHHWGVIQGSLFHQGGLSPINGVFISPVVSNDSKLQGKFMPVLFSVVELVYFYAP